MVSLISESLMSSQASPSIGRPVHYVLSVDVEDYFQVEAFAKQISRSEWDRYPSRVVANTHRLLDLFDEFGAKGTYFIQIGRLLPGGGIRETDIPVGVGPLSVPGSGEHPSPFRSV